MKKETSNNQFVKIIKIFLTAIFVLTYFCLLNIFVIILSLKLAMDNNVIKEIIMDNFTIKYSEAYEVDNDLIAISDVNEIKPTNEIESINEIVSNKEINFDNLDDLSSELEKIFDESNLPPEVYEYLEDNTEAQEVIADFVDEFVGYSIGYNDNMDGAFDSLEDLIYDTIGKYEKEYGVEVDKTEINKLFKDLKAEVENSVKDSEIQEFRNIVNSLFNGIVYSVILYSMGIVLFVIYIINRNVDLFFKIMYIIHIVVGITYISIGKVLLSIFPNIPSLGKNVMNVSSGVLAVGLIALAFSIYRKYSKNRKSDIYA